VAAIWATWRDPWFNRKKEEQGPEEQVVGLHEVAAPDVVGVVLDEGRPRLAATATLADRAHVLLHGPLADLDAALQEFAPDPFGPPTSVLGRHLPDQADGLGGDPTFDAPGPGSPTPEHAKPLAMPAKDGLGLHNGQGAAPRGQHRGCEQEAKPVKRREPGMRRLPAQDHDLVPEHRVLDDEFPSASNNVGRHSARAARPAVGCHRFPHGARSRPDPANDVTQEVHLQLRPRSG